MIRLVILRLLESYFRHRFLYLLPIPIMIAVGAYYFVSAERLYSAGGVLYVQNDSFLGSLSAVRDTPFSYLTPAQRASNEIRDLMQTDAFVRSIIGETSLEQKMNQGAPTVKETLKDVRKAVWAQPIGENQVAIRAAHVDPDLSYELSSAAIDKYLQWKINLDRVQSGTAEEFFSELTEQYRVELELARDNLRDYLVAHPEPVRGARPQIEQLEVDRLTSLLAMEGARYSRALEKDENARLATSQAEADVRQTYFLVDAPFMPLTPETSRRELAMNAGIFVAAGIVLTLLGIAAGALIDRSFRFPIDVQNGLSLPVLSTVPDATPRYRFWQIRKKRDAKAAARERAEMRRQLTEGVLVTIPDYRYWQIRKRRQAQLAAKVRDKLAGQNPDIQLLIPGEQDEHNLVLADGETDEESVVEAGDEADVEIADVVADDEADVEIADMQTDDEADVEIADTEAGDETDVEIADTEAGDEADVEIADMEADDEADVEIADTQTGDETDVEIADTEAGDEADVEIANMEADDEADVEIADMEADDEADERVADTVVDEPNVDEEVYPPAAKDADGQVTFKVTKQNGSEQAPATVATTETADESTNGK